MAKSKKEDWGSRFLYAEDLLWDQQYRTVTVEIEEVIPPFTLKTADGKTVDKPALKFKGKEKMLVLCKTNRSLIVYCTGDTLENAVGKQVTLQPRIVEAFGESVTAIRILPPNGVKVRKKVLERLGTKAVWDGPMPPKKTEPAEEKQSDFDKFATGISKRFETGEADVPKILDSIDTGNMTDNERGELRKLVAERLLQDRIATVTSTESLDEAGPIWTAELDERLHEAAGVVLAAAREGMEAST